ncbi:MAG TPA: hypothetical protein VK543_02450 [Puia sp.]|nr:hypothetical protein [Puia sp.]
MKLEKIVLAVLFLQAFCLKSHSQEITIKEGDFKMLSAEKTVALKFTYDSLQVGKYKKEADYINKRVAEMNNKNPGRGDEWALSWTAQRKGMFEPAYITAFIAASGKDTSSLSKYTLIFNTSFIEQGFSSAAILVHKNPEIRGELMLVRSDDMSKIIAKAKIIKAMGKAGPHFETGEHLDAAYAQAGEGTGTFILNN